MQQGCEKVYKLKKALYRLKQAPKAWYNCIDTYFLKAGFQKCSYEHTLYIKFDISQNILIVCLYVDDLIYRGTDQSMLDDFKQSMMVEFEITDLGMMHYFLGIEVVQSAVGIFITQKKYALEILNKFKMKSYNSVGTLTEPGMKVTMDSKGKKVNNILFK